MRIGINASFLRKLNTGIGQYSKNVIERMVNLKEHKDKKFYLYFEEEGGSNFIEESDNVIKKILKVPFYKRDDLVKKTTWEKIVLPREVKKDEIDVFFTPFNSASYFHSIRHVVTLHDVVWKVFEDQYANNFRKKLYFNKTLDMSEKADHLITVSRFSKREILKYLEVDPNNLTVIRNGVADYFRYQENKAEIERSIKKTGLKPGYIFYIGGFEKRKRVDFLIGAFKKIVDNYPNVLEGRKLVIAGELWNHEDPLITNVKKQIEKHGIEKNVKLLGRVDDQDRPGLYAGADLYIFPSIYEGFGMPVLEAMAAGCPVLASNIPPLAEIAGEAIEFFNPNREDELIQQTLKLLSEREKRLELSLKGMERAQGFDWNETAKRTINVILDS
ncbi:MAG: glycosyltransferase [Candidatus Moranbacteria bacterium]|nr:glycosyltransferase [Candidatus Moranbacteria bacterium]